MFNQTVRMHSISLPLLNVIAYLLQYYPWEHLKGILCTTVSMPSFVRTSLMSKYQGFSREQTMSDFEPIKHHRHVESASCKLARGGHFIRLRNVGEINIMSFLVGR